MEPRGVGKDGVRGRSEASIARGAGVSSAMETIVSKVTRTRVNFCCPGRAGEVLSEIRVKSVVD